MSGLEEGAVEAALSDDGSERAGFQLLMHGNGDGYGAGSFFFLHDSVAAFLAHADKAMLAEQVASGLAGEDFTLGHIPPRTG